MKVPEPSLEVNGLKDRSLEPPFLEVQFFPEDQILVETGVVKGLGALDFTTTDEPLQLTTVSIEKAVV